MTTEGKAAQKSVGNLRLLIFTPGSIKELWYFYPQGQPSR